MPDYDYGNARLHAMKSRLLSSREMVALAGVGSLQGLISALTKTAYRKSVESALTRTTGMDCIEDTLRNNLESTIGKIRDFYTNGAQKLVEIVLRAYDIHNLKAILRGLSKNVPAGEILRVLLPVGTLKYPLLRELARLRNPREAMDALVSMGQPIAWPLSTLRTEQPGVELFELELALEQWHYREAHRSLRTENLLDRALSNALALEADLSNVLTVLRFVREPAERDLLREYFSDGRIEHLFIGPGRIDFELLKGVCDQDSIAAAIESLAGTNLASALQAGLERYEVSQKLSDMEKQLKSYRLKWMANQLVEDPLGIGVVLGYIAVKTNEVSNIRWIAHGIDLGLKTETIRAELEMVS